MSAQDAATEVIVRARRPADELKRSAQPVQVVELAEARQASGDMGEVMARTAGVSVRRAGALGSDQRYSLAGLQDEQVRFFLDGLPLELSGYPFGLANVPVNLVERIEVYSGVVPIRFGADALGGAVQLVSRPTRPGAHSASSYQVGSFDTHRLTLTTSYLARDSGWFARFAGFGDRAQNDYLIHVEEPDADGELKPATVRRFHDAYRANGANLTVGVTDRPWAERLQARAFITEYARELQNDPFMRRPYGDATQSEQTAGGTLSYAQTFGARVSLDWNLGYTFDRRRLRDVGTCIYDWFGRCQSRRRAPGEGVVDGDPHDRVLRTHTGLMRGLASVELGAGQALALSIAPTWAEREGDERRQRNPDARDPLNEPRRLFTFIAGLEHKLDALDQRLQSLLFVKEYTQLSQADALSNSGRVIESDASTHRIGAGASLRYAFHDALWSKASYEYATRLPNIDEIYGNGAQIDQNLGLLPEVSHNLNLTLASQVGTARVGRYRVELTGFMRDAEQLINLIGSSFIVRYSNIASARSLGGQLEASAESPGQYFRLDASATYQDVRNTASTGPFAAFSGDRIPNRPYLFGHVSARVALPELFAERDRIALTWSTRFSESFYRTWESIGRAETKAEVPAQLTHGLSLSYLVSSRDGVVISTSIDLQNLTNARVYDFYGVEKPGRCAFFKVIAEL